MHENGSATGELREEHRLILRVVGALERILDHATDGPPLDDLEACVTFFRLFTDACHHGKEEDVLFPELAEHGFSSETGPVAVMLQEHRRGRTLVGGMARSLERLRADPADRAADGDFRVDAREYTALIRAHIAKEDGVLFEAADRLVDGPGCRRLCDAYSTACARSPLESHTVESLREAARDLATRYGA